MVAFIESDLGANDRLNPVFSGCLSELHRSSQIVMVGEGKGWITQRFSAQYQLFGQRGAFAQ
jgi:hypothetical protein